MGTAKAFQPARLVVGLLSSPKISKNENAELKASLREALALRFGEPDGVGPELPFPWSGYYDEEMGGRPVRSFYSFPRLVDPAELAPIKTWTNELELSLAPQGQRLFNLDPGLLFLSRFVLATTKDRPHRIPLSLGIFAETTLIYESGDYRPLDWTYPDWASEEYRAILRGLRERLKAELRGRES
jgi:hypothetical protein